MGTQRWLGRAATRPVSWPGSRERTDRARNASLMNRRKRLPVPPSGSMATPTVTQRWERYAWAAGALFVLALLAESIVSTAIPINQDDSAEKISAALLEHRTRLIVIACLSIIYAL